MSNSNQNKYYLLASAVAAFVAIGIWNYDSGTVDADDDHDHEHEEFVALTQEQRDNAGIQIETARPGFLQNSVQTHGKIVLNSNHVAHVIPKLSGIVRQVTKNNGDEVEEGETLIVLESREIADAKSAYLGAVKRQIIALQLLDMERELKDKNMTSAQDYQAALKESGNAETEMELARQKLHALGLSSDDVVTLESDDPSQMRFYTIKSPLSGTVLKRHATLGEQLSPDSEAFIIADLDHLWVEIYVYSQDIAKVKKGATINLKALDGQEATAQIISVNPVIDEDTRKSTAVAILDNTDREWNPGSYVSIAIDAGKEPATLIIGKDSVQNIEGEDCVFVEAENGFEIRPVQTGRCDGKRTEILSGISKGERVASTNTFLLKADHLKNEAEHEH